MQVGAAIVAAVAGTGKREELGVVAAEQNRQFARVHNHTVQALIDLHMLE